MSVSFETLKVDSVILAKSEGHYYEAKVLEKEDDALLVHYKGWSRRFDEWLYKDEFCERVMPFSMEVLAKNKKLIEAAKVAEKQKKALIQQKKTKRMSSPEIICDFVKLGKRPSGEITQAIPNKVRRTGNYSVVGVHDKRQELPSKPKRTFMVREPPHLDGPFSTSQVNNSNEKVVACNCGKNGCIQTSAINCELSDDPSDESCEICEMNLLYCLECGGAFIEEVDLKKHCLKEHPNENQMLPQDHQNQKQSMPATGSQFKIVYQNNNVTYAQKMVQPTPLRPSLSHGLQQSSSPHGNHLSVPSTYNQMAKRQVPKHPYVPAHYKYHQPPGNYVPPHAQRSEREAPEKTPADSILRMLRNNPNRPIIACAQKSIEAAQAAVRNVFHCNMCSLSFTNENLFKVHIKGHYVMCRFCNRYIRRSLFQTHIRKDHCNLQLMMPLVKEGVKRDLRNWAYCILCNIPFTSKERREAHIKTMHPSLYEYDT